MLKIFRKCRWRLGLLNGIIGSIQPSPERIFSDPATYDERLKAEGKSIIVFGSLSQGAVRAPWLSKDCMNRSLLDHLMCMVEALRGFDG